MQIEVINTHKILCNDSLEDVLKYIVNLQERSVVAITSKILSVIEQRFVKKNVVDKYQLVKQEADSIVKADNNPYNFYLTLKNGLLIPSAGIDESNADDVYVLYPLDVWYSAERIWKYLRQKHCINELGILITDSHTTIMRHGVTGIALGWYGFDPLYSYMGKPDIYNRLLKVTQVNIADALAVSAVFVMGEGNEQTPIAIITDIPRIVFINTLSNNIAIGLEEDLYAPLLKSVEWE